MGRDPTLDIDTVGDPGQMTRAGASGKNGMIAISVPLDLARELVKDVPEAQEPETLHVTLCVFASPPPDEAAKEEVQDIVKAVVKDYGPMAMKITGIGQFAVTEHSDGKYPPLPW
jgi:hypothetical protein